MSRTRLTALAALALVLLSAAVFFTRRATGGVDAGPPGASVWEVSVTARGEFPPPDKKGAKAKAEPRLVLYMPPDFRRQHIYDEVWKSDQLNCPDDRPKGTVKGPRERAVCKPNPDGAADKGYRVTYTFRAVLGMHAPSEAMGGRAKQLDAPPKGDSDRTLTSTPRVQSTRAEITELADALGGDDPFARYRAFHAHVASLDHHDGPGQTALDTVRNEGGDDAGKSRLLVALCRANGIPARVVVGTVLTPNATPKFHRWVEAWVKGPDRPDPHWVPACPTFNRFGGRGWPPNYVVMRIGDGPVVSAPGGPRVSLFARPLPVRPPGETRAQALWRAVSLASLPPAEQHLARFIVLMPLATVIVSAFRVVVGFRTFGVFGPALLGLIFRDLRLVGVGLAVFAATVLVGWVFRKLLDRFHLLLIPRAAVLLTMIVTFLLAVLLVSARFDVRVSGYLALFPLIILTHMVERFWTVEAEDGSWSALKTLAGTLAVSVLVAVALSPDAVARTVFRFPETLGVIVAVLLLLGRYTGYRLTELYRFQDVIEPARRDEGGSMKGEVSKEPHPAPAPSP